jgi:hypothetical protein
MIALHEEPICALILHYGAGVKSLYTTLMKANIKREALWRPAGARNFGN